MGWRSIAVFTAGCLTAIAAPASAQSFGGNKIHYEDLEFRVLETPHFDLYYYPAEHDAVVEAGRMAERWYARLSATLGHALRRRQPIIVYASHAQFTQTNVISGLLGDGVGGVTEHQKGRIVLPFAAGLGETDHVLGHELVHAFQRDVLEANGRSLALLPLWFVEGMAEYLSIGRIDANTAMWLRDSLNTDRLPRIRELEDPRWFPYRYGQALWAYLAARFGEDVIARSLTSKASGGAIGRLVAVTGLTERTLSDDWHQSIRETGAGLATPSAPAPTAIVKTNASDGRLNVAPALSPDGRSVAFLSERDRFSIDLFLADAATGLVKRTLIRTAADPHFESLQFIESAGAWDPAGGRFALAALSHGQPVLAILNMTRGIIDREVRLGSLDQIFSPTWSPDGRRLAFAALKGGLCDLYVLDLGTEKVTALTRDAFADLQPSWSPDGQTIVFSTDRFSSSIDTLSFGNYRLGAIDVASGTIRELPGVPGGKNIDPHWSADGRQIYFIGDGTGMSNVYRMTMASGDVCQVTAVSTGVSGVTALSPALSTARRADGLVFSVFRGGGYELEAVAEPACTAPGAAAAEEANPAPAPGARPRSPAAASALGLLDGKAFTDRSYRRSLMFAGVAQPYLSAGGGGTGTFLRAGVAFGLGDMLGDQQWQSAIQVSNHASDFAAQTTYLNLRGRWNWGMGAALVPWAVGAGQQTFPSGPASNGGPTITRQLDVFRQVHRQVSALTMYAFDSARRVELGMGLDAISFDRETATSVYSSATGNRISQRSSTAKAAAPATLVEARAALVRDTALFGPVSPIFGERYRFELAPTVGTLSFATITADFRKYVMPFWPVTIALRVEHVGRYGGDAADPRLLPVVWTLRDVVRGYGDVLGVTTTCDASAACAAVTPPGAHRMTIGNVELRVPLSTVFRRRARANSLPLEAIGFADAGEFWRPSGGTATVATRTILRSIGAGIRLNAAGVVFEFDAVRPLDLHPTGWTLAVNFRPGF